MRRTSQPPPVFSPLRQHCLDPPASEPVPGPFSKLGQFNILFARESAEILSIRIKLLFSEGNPQKGKEAEFLSRRLRILLPGKINIMFSELGEGTRKTIFQARNELAGNFAKILMAGGSFSARNLLDAIELAKASAKSAEENGAGHWDAARLALKVFEASPAVLRFQLKREFSDFADLTLKFSSSMSPEAALLFLSRISEAKDRNVLHGILGAAREAQKNESRLTKRISEMPPTP